MTPTVAARPPDEWRAAQGESASAADGERQIAPPKIAESAGAVLTGWTVARAEAHDGAALVTGCVATPIPGWVEDMRPSVEGRTVALAGAVAERITGFPMDARGGSGGELILRAASDLDGPTLGLARTFIGFDEHRVFTCFATCATRQRQKSGGGGVMARVGCEDAVRSSRLEGSGEPPQPGLGLRSVTWAVHHPQPAALGAGFAIVALGVLAVIVRRRPQSGPALGRRRGGAGAADAPDT